MAVQAEKNFRTGPGDVGTDMSFVHERRYGVRAATLANIRWVAVTGQLITILFVHFFLDFDLALISSLAVILVSVWFNILAASFLPPNARLSERAALGWLIFDAVQLAILLALSGGLSNPFCILFLATTTISAAALTIWGARIVVAVCLVLIVLIELWHFPLVRTSGEELILPVIYRVGFALALLVGITFTAGYNGRIAEEAFGMSQALAATQLALSREHQLSSLGAMAAAAAHELGTPLATIAVTAREMERNLPDGIDKEGDLALIREQTARCRDILAEFAGIQRQDITGFQEVPLLSILEEAASPHRHAGKTVVFMVNGALVHDVAPITPGIERRPEIIHGLRNLIQNAVDFAHSTVTIHTHVSAERLEVQIEDDGMGYPAEVLGRLGEPFVTSRSRRKNAETDYEGMGLGIFIAKTLLERRGLSVTFFNRRGRGRASGATVQLLWPLDPVQQDETDPAVEPKAGELL